MPESIAEATERAIAAARHLTDLDAGAVAALRALANKIDHWDDVVDAASDQREDGQKLTIPVHDNVSIPAYLKYCEALRLTPASRGVVVGENEAKGKLANLRSLRGGKNDTAEDRSAG